MVPGVASIDTIEANHKNLVAINQFTGEPEKKVLEAAVGLAKTEGNVARADLEEGARLAGLDVIVNSVINLRRDTIGLFVGDLVAAHREGVKLAEAVYATPRPEDTDIIVVNTYSKANEAFLALRLARQTLRGSQGQLVLIANTPEGTMTHYLLGSFGHYVGGRLWSGRAGMGKNVPDLILVSQYLDIGQLSWFGCPDSIRWTKNWSDALNILKTMYPHQAKVAVIPDGTIQCWKGC